MSLTAGWEKQFYDFARRNLFRRLCWEMDIVKCLPWECGTPVYMSATWKMLKKKFFGKVIHCIRADKTYFKINARWALSCKHLLDSGLADWNLDCQKRTWQSNTLYY